MKYKITVYDEAYLEKINHMGITMINYNMLWNEKYTGE